MQSMWLIPWTRQFQGATHSVLTSCIQNFCELSFFAIADHFDTILNVICFLCTSYFSLMWRIWFHNSFCCWKNKIRSILLSSNDSFFGVPGVVSVTVLSKEEKLGMRSWLAFLICSKFRTRTSIPVDWSQAFSLCRYWLLNFHRSDILVPQL